MSRVEQRRFLATSVVTSDGIKGLSLVNCEEKRVEVTPFVKETHSTSYLACGVMFVKAEMFDEFVMDDVSRAAEKMGVEAANYLYEMFSAGNVLAEGGEDTIILTIEPGCRVIWPC